MARIQLENVKKKFGKVTALDGVTIDVKDNEFFVLFGPAGAGKTTMLNCIAGITLPEEGLIKFDGEIMNLVDPAHRNVAMTFENYALYPQMTVYDNMAAALRSNLYKTDEATIKEKVYKAAKIMKMENLLERLPSQLSNGQKQRVAMGRSLVRNPNVFLMDEPLAHLGCQAAQLHAHRAEEDPGRSGLHLYLRDPRLFGGHGPGRPHRHREGGPHRSGGLRRRDLLPALQ